MNENTLKFLEALADKLGTTAEYLWTILLKQAPVQSTIDLVVMIFLIIIGVVLFKLHEKFSTPKSNYSSYTTYDDYYHLDTCMAIIAIIWGLAMVYYLCSIPTIISGFFNPEYWALRKILNSIK